MSQRYYEIINPSDKVVLTADESDELLVSIAVIILGSGKAGLQRDDDADIVPLMLFGGSFDKWLTSKGLTEATFSATLHANRIKIATICETVFYGSIEEAKALDAALSVLPREQALDARAKYNDVKRSSLNDWGAACLSWAAKLREADQRDAAGRK